MPTPRDNDPRLRRFARELRECSTDAERRLWSRLRDRRFERWKFRRQMPVAGYVVDFVCLEANLIIELDGGQHGQPDAEAYDARRSADLEAMGFRVLRFWNSDALRRTSSVMQDIYDALGRGPPPRPSPGVPEEGAIERRGEDHVG